MGLLKYNQYITENKAYQLLLESKVVFSSKFINILSKMKDNKISKDLLSIYSKDIDVTHNYVDITDQKDSVSFTPDRKAQELIKDKPDTWKVIDSGRYLTHSDRNNKIFESLGYEKKGSEPWVPSTGIIGLILRETISETSGNTYVLFQEYGVSDEPRQSVINKKALEPTEAENSEVWGTSRNNIKVGRLVRAMLKAANTEFLDKDIEEFTNQYKATFDFMADVLKQFDIVDGDKIAYWYHEDNYVSGGGTLNNSCMAEVPSKYFKIYTKNPKQCNLVILYGDNGEIKDGKYTAKTIKGRALLWTGKLDGRDAKFMDRVYTTHDSDLELFKQFAEKNGWWYKQSQTMYPDAKLTDGKTTKSAVFEVHLDKGRWSYYPYMDTMCFLDMDDDKLHNDKDGSYDRVFRSTEGDYWSDYDD